MKRLKSILSLKLASVLTAFLIGGLILHGDLKEQFLRNYVGHNTYKVLVDGGTGSGFVVRYGGRSFVITNAHVCGEAKSVSLEDKRNVSVSTANVIAKDVDLDLCAIENVENKHGLYIQNHDPYQGQSLNVVGHPSGSALVVTPTSFIQSETIEIPSYEFIECNGTLVRLSTIEMILRSSPTDEVCVNSYNLNRLWGISASGVSGAPVVNNFGVVTGVVTSLNEKKKYINSVLRLDLIKFLESL